MFSSRISPRLVAIVLICALFAGLAAPVRNAQAATVYAYNAIPDTLPGNMGSVGFQATQTSEFGDYIHLAGTNRDLKNLTVTMSTWALHSSYPSMSTSGWQHPITLNIYNVVTGTPNTTGSLIVSKTQTFDIPWRPEGVAECPSNGYGLRWLAPDGNCYNGYAFNITFDLASLNITLPNDIIIGIAYNTNTWGYAPIGVGGPYESLNVGAVGTLTTGTDDSIDKVFWNTKTAGYYADGGTGGVGVFREDSNWTGNGTLPVKIEVKDGVFPTTTLSTPANGTTLTTGPTQLFVTFSEDVKHDGSSGAADNTINYRLFEDGANNVFDTEDCAGNVLTDDAEIFIDGAAYEPSTFTATLNINGGAVLPAGNYRLLVCGTTSIEGLDGDKLNSGLIDSVVNFSVSAPVQVSAAGVVLPATGFAPDRVTELPIQSVAYSNSGDLRLEIPSLKVDTTILGVPQSNGEWDVSWLGSNAGWLQGSAFPGFTGNSVVTGHVWDADNTPGVFYGIGNLKYGDQVIIHFGSTDYVYEVRALKTINNSNTKEMFKHEDRPWITLVTCKGFDQASGEYLYRILVRAVLVEVK